MKILFWHVMMLLGLSAPLAGIGFQEHEYCAFEVIIKTSRGEAVRHARVVLYDDTGSAFASAVVNEKGVARICDAPPGLLRLSVGGTLCGTASVGQIKRYWMQTRKVTITFDNCSGEGWAPLGGCMLTLRIRGTEDTPLAEARLRNLVERLKSREQTDVSDQWGRIFQFLKFGDVLVATIEKDGYWAKSVHAECKRGEPFDRDMTVVLEANPQK